MKVFVVIFILVIVLLLSLIWRRYSCTLEGGEYRKIRLSNGNELLPSISMLSLNPSDIKRYKTASISDESILEKCTNKLIDLCRIQWNDEYGYFEDATKAKYTSDAFIDMLMLYKINKTIIYGIGACEWYLDTNVPSGTNVIVTFNTSDYLEHWKFHRHESNIWLTKPYLAFQDYGWSIDRSLPNPDINEIDDFKTWLKYWTSSGKDGFRLKIKNETKISSAKEQAAWFHSILRSKLRSYQSKRFHIVETFLSSKTNSNISSLYQQIFNILGFLDDLSHVNPKPTIDIYIEYSYNNERSTELYERIHNHTYKIIDNIMKIPMNTNTHYVYCLRFLIKGTELPIINFNGDDKTPKLRTITIDGKHRTNVTIYDETEYSVVMAPNTTENFKADEQIFISTKDFHYSIQIEHSEDGSDHKSNFIEFIGRTLSPYIDLQGMIKVLSKTNYIKEGKLINWRPCPSSKGKYPSSVVFSSFGKHAEYIFNPKPLAKK